MTERLTLVAWRDPRKVVITKDRMHAGGWWLVTLYAVRTLEFRSYDEACRFAAIVADGSAFWRPA